jgi:hypothetical protein
MPRVIVKCRYYNSERSVYSAGGYLEYIGTREGVEKLGDAWKTEKATKNQVDFINAIVQKKSAITRTDEYKNFLASQTRGNASELISSIIENNPELLSYKTYLDYMATRPRVEKIEGTHGLFSDSDKVINLSEASKRVTEHKGNVYTVIVSIKRNDAEQLEYNTAERWRDLVRAHIDEIAEQHQIPLRDLEWYGAFHNESNHPHIHLLLYSRNEQEKGYITKTGIDNLRRMFGTAIFADEIHQLYDEQTERRNKLNSESIDEFNELCMMVEQGLCTNPKIVKMVTDLSERLKTVKGKKQYGYLPKSVKAMVDGIVDELEEDEHIKRLYDLWYECKCLIYQTYTDVSPKHLPLSQENAFKPIRNAVIKRASELAFELADDDPMPQENTHTSDSSTTTSGTSIGSSTTSSTSTHTSSSTEPTSSNQYKPQILTKVTRLGKDIADIFRDRYQEMVDNPAITVDSKLKREIEAKKKGQRLSM